MKWEVVYEDDDSEFHNHEYNFVDNLNRGIVLVVGFVPGLKTETIPLLRSKQVSFLLSVRFSWTSP